MSLLKKSKKIKVPVAKLVPGLYVDLELSWNKHPFLFSRFKIKTQQEVDIIQGLDLQEVTVIPSKSDAKVPAADKQQAPVQVASEEQLWQEKEAKVQEAAQYRRRRSELAKRYKETVKKVKRLTQDLNVSPANAMRDAAEVVDEMAKAFESDGDILINLINISPDDYSFYNHALNTTVLAMLVGRSLGIKGEQLRDLGIGAMLHDVGKALLPSAVVMKRGPLTKAEKSLLQTHTIAGVKLASKVHDLSKDAKAIIAQHHEFLDGSGYPQGLKGEAINNNAKIVAITNIYDNLCNPPNPDNALPPKAVMAILFAKYKGKLDGTLVQRFITNMGVYPPGTVVRLSDDSIGLVTAINAKALLKPQVLLYSPDIPRREALSIDLAEQDEISITDVLKPEDYDKRIYDYLGIKERVGYFFEMIDMNR
ncbi:HD-GYP domain-containing protein [Maricurvus nonylphenolicus]|uniref:HD-GYP domain-containing protein n=1 Tax=Maricurvus nonylphenolicus TaxID=1008307 RepID=UPI0036F36443